MDTKAIEAVMTIRESERYAQRQRSPHRLKKHKLKHPSALDVPLSMLNDAQVLTVFEWARLNRISMRTARRVLQSGEGPPTVRLSERRIGITVGTNRLWQQSRERLA
jgi:hypothetical protein